MDIAPEKVKKWNVSKQAQWLEGIDIIREKQKLLKIRWRENWKVICYKEEIKI